MSIVPNEEHCGRREQSDDAEKELVPGDCEEVYEGGHDADGAHERS